MMVVLLMVDVARFAVLSCPVLSCPCHLPLPHSYWNLPRFEPDSWASFWSVALRAEFAAISALLSRGMHNFAVTSLKRR